MVIGFHNVIALSLLVVFSIRHGHFSALLSGGIIILAVGWAIGILALPVWIHLNRKRAQFFTRKSQFDERFHQVSAILADAFAFAIAVAHLWLFDFHLRLLELIHMAIQVEAKIWG